MLLSLLNLDFSGDLSARMEAFEREFADYEQASQEQASDGIRVSAVLQRLEESTMEQHLLLNSERLTKWADFRAEVINVNASA